MEKKPKSSYRPWPKKHDGLRKVIDRDKIRDLYLNGPHYIWAGFCGEHNFDPSARKRAEFPYKVWQQTWIQQQTEVVVEEVLPKAIELKKKIAEARLQFPNQWNETTMALRGLQNEITRKHILNMQHDRANAEQISRGEVKAKFNMSATELQILANAARSIQEIHLKSMLMPPGDPYQAVIPIKDSDPEFVAAEAEGERLRNIPHELMGGGTLDSDKMTHILDKWIDQSSVSKLRENEDDNAISPEETLDSLDGPL